MGVENPITPLRTTTSMDYKPSSQEEDTTTTQTPTYSVPDTPTYYDTSLPSQSDHTNTKEEDIKTIDDDDEARSSKWQRLRSNLEKLSSINALRDGETTPPANFTNSTIKKGWYS